MIARGGRAAAALGILLGAAPAAADHGDALRSASNPVLEALLWAGVAFLVGIAIVGALTFLARRKRPSQ